MGCSQSQPYQKPPLMKFRSKRLLSFHPSPKHPSPNGEGIMTGSLRVNLMNLKSPSISSVKSLNAIPVAQKSSKQNSSKRVAPLLDLSHEAVPYTSDDQDDNDNILYADIGGKEFPISPENYANYGNSNVTSRKFFDHSEYSDRRSYTSTVNPDQEYNFANRIQMIKENSKLSSKYNYSPNSKIRKSTTSSKKNNSSDFHKNSGGSSKKTSRIDSTDTERDVIVKDPIIIKEVDQDNSKIDLCNSDTSNETI